MDIALLEVVLEVDDGGLLVAVHEWVEVLIQVAPTCMRIDVQPHRRYDRVTLN